MYSWRTRLERRRNDATPTVSAARGMCCVVQIQTYCSTAPVEPESQVAFSTSCIGGEAKEWVLAEANAAGFNDIGEWAGTLNLKQFLGKIKERFLDKTTADKAFDQLTTIGQKHWTSVESLSREVDRLLQVPGLNLQDNQVLYIYFRALPEPIRGQLVAESKSGKYNYRQFRDLALQREQMISQVKNSYASVVKYGGGAGTGNKIDLKSGYHQIEVEPCDQHKIAFRTSDGQASKVRPMDGLEEGQSDRQVLLDFRTAFHGSVFEQYHMLPIQVTTLDAVKSATSDGFWYLSEFLLQAGNADLLKRDRDAFVPQFDTFVETDLDSDDMLMYHAYIDMAKAFLNELPDVFEEVFSSVEPNKKSANSYMVHAELAVRLAGFVLAHSRDYLAKMFHRSGMDVVQESDLSLASNMFHFCRNMQKEPWDDTYFSRAIVVHFIDFDLVGSDGKHFPLRMRMLNMIWEEELGTGWFADVQDHETDILIATASDVSSDNLTELQIMAADIVKQRYKPHGDITTLQLTSGYFKYSSDEDPEEGHANLLCIAPILTDVPKDMLFGVLEIVELEMDKKRIEVDYR
ncbi:hypothetical protein CBR_g56908 [Chara braunii]|uniref:Uncharacterized protein n=1 Tax=Chara braunii TaxID=69332 RepID=A0A388MDW3_CHABU|nr:hypothetical protein CBR_g56908 [Chara braunii]|eukprot:GBG92747.1 hypothetical protein CBR_g56908 [Chara braunii]